MGGVNVAQDAENSKTGEMSRQQSNVVSEEQNHTEAQESGVSVISSKLESDKFHQVRRHFHQKAKRVSTNKSLSTHQSNTTTEPMLSEKNIGAETKKEEEESFRETSVKSRVQITTSQDSQNNDSKARNKKCRRKKKKNPSQLQFCDNNNKRGENENGGRRSKFVKKKTEKIPEANNDTKKLNNSHSSTESSSADSSAGSESNSLTRSGKNSIEAWKKRRMCSRVESNPTMKPKPEPEVIRSNSSDEKDGKDVKEKREEPPKCSSTPLDDDNKFSTTDEELKLIKPDYANPSESSFFNCLNAEINNEIAYCNQYMESISPYCTKIQSIFESLARELYKKTEIKAEMYGSMATRLALPASDLDLIICGLELHNKDDIVDAAKLFSENASKIPCVIQCQPILTAKVPVIKTVSIANIKKCIDN